MSIPSLSQNSRSIARGRESLTSACLASSCSLEYRRLLVDEALWKSGRSHLSETSSEQGCTDTARSDDGASANGGGKEKELSGVEQDEPFWDESSEADEKEALTSKT